MCSIRKKLTGAPKTFNMTMQKASHARAWEASQSELCRSRYSALICAWTAVMAVTAAMSSAEQPRERSFTGLAMPWRIGP